MKKRIFCLFVLIGILILQAGCKPRSVQTINLPEATVLTEEELAYFNSDSLFNGMDFNFYNQFLSSTYGSPEEIDLFELFYCGVNQNSSMTKEELKAVMTAENMTGEIEDLPCGCDKIKSAEMDKILTDYLGKTLEETKKIGLEKFTYLPQYDAYYHFHGDTNYRMNIQFSNGECEGEIIRLFYDDIFFGDGNKTLTLKEKDNGYLFVSNQNNTVDAK